MQKGNLGKIFQFVGPHRKRWVLLPQNFLQKKTKHYVEVCDIQGVCANINVFLLKENRGAFLHGNHSQISWKHLETIIDFDLFFKMMDHEGLQKDKEAHEGSQKRMKH